MMITDPGVLFSHRGTSVQQDQSYLSSTRSATVPHSLLYTILRLLLFIMFRFKIWNNLTFTSGIRLPVLRFLAPLT